MLPAVVNSLPKSGTNLLAKCLVLMGYEETAHIGSHDVLGRSALCRVRRLMWRSSEPGYIVGIDTPVEIARKPIDRRLAGLSPGRFATAHVGYTDDLLKKVLEENLRPVVMIRDPRAVIASLVAYIVKTTRHHCHELFAELAPRRRYECAIAGVSTKRYALQSIHTRCHALSAWLACEGSLTVRFEDLVGEAGGGSAEAQSRTIEAIRDHLEISGGDPKQVANRLFGDSGRTFRSGKVDSWRNEIPADIQADLGKSMARVLEQWGYAGTGEIQVARP